MHRKIECFKLLNAILEKRVFFITQFLTCFISRKEQNSSGIGFIVVLLLFCFCLGVICFLLYYVALSNYFTWPSLHYSQVFLICAFSCCSGTG